LSECSIATSARGRAALISATQVRGRTLAGSGLSELEPITSNQQLATSREEAG
jgi:hypothetical protein